MTDTQRAASEMLLVSQAVDEAIQQIDCSQLAGKKVFFDSQYLRGSVDEGYIISSIREHLFSHGALLLEQRENAEIIVEARNGGVGTDRQGMFIGTPQLTVPTIVLPQPTTIPELALIKKTNQKGIAKIALFAYHRDTGRGLWLSGHLRGQSSLKEAWFFGAGPISYGSIRPRAELVGEELPKLPRIPIPFSRPDPIVPADNEDNDLKLGDFQLPPATLPNQEYKPIK